MSDSVQPISGAVMLPSSSSWYGPALPMGSISVTLLAGLPSNRITKRGVEMRCMLAKATQSRIAINATTVKRTVVFAFIVSVSKMGIPPVVHNEDHVYQVLADKRPCRGELVGFARGHCDN